MTNTLGNYNVPLYSSTLLINLEKALGMGRRVHNGFDAERRTFDQGQVINIKRPSDFTAAAAPASTVQDVNVGSVAITLSTWQEVVIKLTDQELAYTSSRIMEDHIPRIAHALADKVDQDLWGLYKYVPWVDNHDGSTMAVADILAARKILLDNKAPLWDQGNMHFGVGTDEEADLLALSPFTQWQGSGATGTEAQIMAEVGKRYGFQFFTSQNRPTHTPGTMADASGTLNGNHAKGATSVAVSGVTATTGTVKIGDSFVIAGDSQRYVIAADATADGSGDITLTVGNDGGLVQASTTGAVVTIDVEGTKTKQNLAFHRDAFALAFARLPDYRDQPNQLGANIFSVQDRNSGIACRVSIFYEGKESAAYLKGDLLYGVKVLNPNLAIRSRK